MPSQELREGHVPVLLEESIEGLNLGGNKIFLDGTLGAGGHTRAVLKRYPKTRVIGLDQDPKNLELLQKELGIETRNANFRHLDQALLELEIEAVDAILFDLGFSSEQVDDAKRGLSFQKDGPLDMRLGKQEVTAAIILNSWDESAIELILRGFGEERYSRRIAQAIVARRGVEPFRTTFDLVRVVENAVPASFKKSRINPATKTFQALRIAVNEELDVLEEGLESGFRCLKPGGRFAVISFHSLEDRIVKNLFKQLAKESFAKLINKKPIVAGVEEMKRNPRARSAKLRLLEKI